LANKEAKAPLVDDLADRLGRSSIAIVTDYRGLSVAEMLDLRRRLRSANVEYRVSKNTLTRFAADKAEKPAMKADLEGPTAIAFGYDDAASAAKAVQDYVRASRVLRVKGAMLGDRRLAGRPELQARLVGTFQAPMSSLIGTVNGLLTQLVYVFDQRAQQVGQNSASTAEASE
jgi:large subunit ribosomal protein L10